MSHDASSLDGESLQRRLHELQASRRVGRVCAHWWMKGARHAASADCYPAVAGCLAKFLTAMLVSLACSEHLLGLEDTAAAVLRRHGLRVDGEDHLQGVRICDLLNHTHGIDAAHVEELPLVRIDGRLDVRHLCARMFSVPSLARPAEYFSYGSAGALLATCVLEHVYERPYASLLQEKLFEPLGIQALAGDLTLGEALRRRLPIDICPARGGRLRLTSADLLTLTRCHLPQSTNDTGTHAYPVSAAASLAQHRFPVTGWMRGLQGICLGYHDFGAGWYGHNSVVPGGSALVRFCPRREIAIAITADDELGAFKTLAALFGPAMPELASIRLPRRLSAGECSPTLASACVGRYENAALILEIDMTQDGLLRIRVYRKDPPDFYPDEPYIKRNLSAAEGMVFFPSPPEPLVIPCVQFFDITPEGHYRYLHNGRRLFVRQPIA